MKRLRVPVFVTPAIFLASCFLALHAFGLREDASVLSGTVPSNSFAGVAGLLYVAAWFCAVVVAPILAIAAVVRAGLRLGFRRVLSRVDIEQK